MNPKLKWSLIVMLLIILVAPTLGAQIVQWIAELVSGGIAALKTFGEAVVPK